MNIPDAHVGKIHTFAAVMTAIVVMVRRTTMTEIVNMAATKRRAFVI